MQSAAVVLYNTTGSGALDDLTGTSPLRKSGKVDFQDFCWIFKARPYSAQDKIRSRLTARNPFFAKIMPYFNVLRQNGVVLHNCNTNATLDKKIHASYFLSGSLWPSLLRSLAGSLSPSLSLFLTLYEAWIFI